MDELATAIYVSNLDRAEAKISSLRAAQQQFLRILGSLEMHMFEIQRYYSETPEQLAIQAEQASHLTKKLMFIQQRISKCQQRLAVIKCRLEDSAVQKP